MKDTPTEAPTPREVAEQLRASGMAEDDVLDLLWRVGELIGWTPQLNECGLVYLKPDAPAGEEMAA